MELDIVSLDYIYLTPLGDTGLVENKASISLPKMHALALAAFFFNGGAPEGIFALDKSGNSWITDEDRAYIESNEDAIVRFPG